MVCLALLFRLPLKIVMKCQVPVSIDFRVHLNSAKPVWIVSVMIRTKTMALILKMTKKMTKLQTPVEARRSRKKKRKTKKVKTAKRRSKIVMRLKSVFTCAVETAVESESY